MGEPAFRTAVRELEAEKQRKINELIKAEALKEERARAMQMQPSADSDVSTGPTPRKEADEEEERGNLNVDPEPDPHPTERPTLTPEQIKKIKLAFLAEQGVFPYGKPEPEPDPKPQPQTDPAPPKTKKTSKKILLTVHGEVAEWLAWKRREGYTLSIFCERCMEKAMVKDAEWLHYKEHGEV